MVYSVEGSAEIKGNKNSGVTSISGVEDMIECAEKSSFSAVIAAIS